MSHCPSDLGDNQTFILLQISWNYMIFFKNAFGVLHLLAIKFLWNEGWNPRNSLRGWSLNFYGFQKEESSVGLKDPGDENILHTCTNTQSQTQIWSHVKKSATAGSWGCLKCGNQRGPLAHKLISVLVWSFDINAVYLSSRSPLIFKWCTSRSCGYGCTTNSRMPTFSEQPLKMRHNNQRLLPPAGEGEKQQRCVEEWPTLQDSGTASW